MINELNKQLEDLKNRIDEKKSEMNSQPLIQIIILVIIFKMKLKVVGKVEVE